MNIRIWKVSSGFPGVLELPSRIRCCSAKTWGERWGRGGKWSPRNHVLHVHVCAARAGRWVSPRTDRHRPRPFQISTAGSGSPARRVLGPEEPVMPQPWYLCYPGTHEPHLVARKPCPDGALTPLPVGLWVIATHQGALFLAEFLSARVFCF